jgi:hypothetical protein
MLEIAHRMLKGLRRVKLIGPSRQRQLTEHGYEHCIVARTRALSRTIDVLFKGPGFVGLSRLLLFLGDPRTAAPALRVRTVPVFRDTLYVKQTCSVQLYRPWQRLHITFAQGSFPSQRVRAARLIWGVRWSKSLVL